MIIRDLRRESSPRGARVTARVGWEDSDRPARDVYFETDARGAETLTPSPDAFVTGCIVPALRHGERRVAIEGSVCPQLRDNLQVALSILRSWYGRTRPAIAIEPSEGFRPTRRAPPRTASLLSGGVDSFYTLRSNRLEIPLDHPASIRDGIVILGHDFGLPDSSPSEYEQFEHRVRSLEDLSRGRSLSLIPMRFNLRDLDDDLQFYIDEFFGAALAAAAHALTARISSLSIGSSYDLDHEIPCGSHAFLDPYFASSALSIRHDGAHATRLQKLRLVAEWPEGLRRLQTCNVRPPPAGRANCGTCEKCLRTSVGLLVLGQLDGAESFSERDVTPESLRRMAWTPSFEQYWQELVDPLHGIGRGDLARIVEEKLEASRRFHAWRDETDWKGRIKRIDRRYLRGGLSRIARAVRSPAVGRHQ